MSQHPSDRPYIQAWLKRLERQLRGSGRISQIALALTQTRGGKAEQWSRQIRDILDGHQLPDAELIADIDRILAKPGTTDQSSTSSQGDLF